MKAAQHRPSTTLADRPSFLLSQTGAHVAARFAELLEPYGLDPRRFGILSVVSAGGGLSQQRLAEMLGIHRNSMVAVIDDLEGRGMVERRRHPSDRRAHALFPTASGRARLHQARDVLDRLEAELLAGFSAADCRALTALLRRIADGNGLLPGVHPGLQRLGDAPPAPTRRSRPVA